MKIGRHRKAPTIAITDATLSEIAKLADRTLYYSSNSPAFVRSHTGLLSIIQALAYGVYSRDTTQYDERIRAFKLKYRRPGARAQRRPRGDPAGRVDVLPRDVGTTSTAGRSRRRSRRSARRPIPLPHPAGV